MSATGLTGGAVRILWDADDSATVTITGNGTPTFTVNGSAVVFPYTLSASTTFETDQTGTYEVSVQHHGVEIADTPDKARTVQLRGGGQDIFAPTPDAGGSSQEFLANLNNALSATYATRQRAVYGPRWVFDGDSITINGIATAFGNQDRSRTWTAEVARQSMGRINYVGNAADPGQRVDQALARFDAYVAPLTPDVVFLTIGTNDVGQSRTMTQWLTDVESYWNKCKAIGADLVLGAIWPTDDDTPTGRKAITRTWNTALYEWAGARKIQVVPWDTLADPTTGGWPTGWSTDGIHPTGSNSYAVIGALGWKSLEPKAGPPVVRRAVANGAGALSNGFFTTLNATLNPPDLTAGTSDTTSGTLPAGTYSYRYTSRTFWGEGLPSVERQVTLAAPGKITITNATVSGSRGYRVYRKGPSDSTWKYLTFLNGGTIVTFTDDGSLTPGADMPGVDTSRTPTGLTNNSSTVHEPGPVTFTETGIRGNIFRSTPYFGGTGAPADFLSFAAVPGEVYDVSALVRSSGTAEGVLAVRFRDAGNVAIGQVYVARDRMTNAFGLAAHRIVVPANTATVRISFEMSDSLGGYADFAEVRAEKIA